MSPHPRPRFAFALSPSVFAGPHPLKTGLPLEVSLDELASGGITLVIDLTKEGELQDAHYRGLLSERGIRHRRMPFVNGSTPTNEAMVEILDLLDKQTGEEGSYIHCLLGVGRTGTVAGCFLRRRGDADWQELLDRKREEAGYAPGAPSAEDQVAFVDGWQPGS